MVYSALNGETVLQKGVFWHIQRKYCFGLLTHYIYQGVELCRVETMDMGELHWNNAVNEKYSPSKYHSAYCTGLNNLLGVIQF